MRTLALVLLLSITTLASAQTPIVATLVATPHLLTATVRNTGSSPWQMHAIQLGIAQLSVDVRDASGRRIGTVPPPVPRPGDDARETLAPGASRTFELSLNVFSPPLPPGTYTIDWGEREGIAATPVTFVVAP